MNVQVNARESSTLEQFAEKHGLCMEIYERSRRFCGNWPDDRYYAKFDSCEVMSDGFLLAEYGNGATPNDAMRNYGKLIEGKRIVVKAYSSERREIEVPNQFV